MAVLRAADRVADPATIVHGDTRSLDAGLSPANAGHDGDAILEPLGTFYDRFAAQEPTSY
jgi:hypothetical protein